MSQQPTTAPYPGPPEIYIQRCQQAQIGAEAQARSVCDTVVPQHNRECICLPNAFSPCGGPASWSSNELLLKDECMRKLAYVAPLDCDIKQLYIVNPSPPKL